MKTDIPFLPPFPHLSKADFCRSNADFCRSKADFCRSKADFCRSKADFCCSKADFCRCCCCHLSDLLKHSIAINYYIS